ncbi:MAG: hypothetical protein EPN79_11275 [Burkholderiaceae bacterium]|nr:MAG: hypothetical protein EPN79_11275 [Burkholderiaceae bacterium]TBR76736.1 MAG: hypothetical protein EPN64_05800 [Burkholderiaceae bacterium]
MAIHKSNGGGRKNLTFISLVERTNKHMSAAEIEKDPEHKAPGFLYREADTGSYALADKLTGFVVSVKTGTDSYTPAGGQPEVYPIATVRLSDNESVKVRLDQNLGRTVIGLLAANALSHGDGAIDIYVNHIRAGGRIGDGPAFDKDKSFINVKPMGADTTEKFKPIYAGDDGQILVDAEGKPAPLPKADIVRFQGKDRYDWEKINNIAVNTARGLEGFYKDKEASAHNQGAAPAHDDPIDLDAAAAAAAPRA